VDTNTSNKKEYQIEQEGSIDSSLKAEKYKKTVVLICNYLFQLIPIFVLFIIGGLSNIVFSYNEYSGNIVVIVMVTAAVQMFLEANSGEKNHSFDTRKMVSMMINILFVSLGAVLYSLLLIANNSSMVEINEMGMLVIAVVLLAGKALLDFIGIARRGNYDE
jgi:hypothetical protein